MGCSNPHPHGQIWAQQQLPTLVMKKQNAQLAYFEQHGSNLLQDYVVREVENKERAVVMNNDWLVVVPYWAAWPFETLLVPRFTVTRITELNAQQNSLSRIFLNKSLLNMTTYLSVLFLIPWAGMALLLIINSMMNGHYMRASSRHY